MAYEINHPNSISTMKWAFLFCILSIPWTVNGFGSTPFLSSTPSLSSFLPPLSPFQTQTQTQTQKNRYHARVYQVSSSSSVTEKDTNNPPTNYDNAPQLKFYHDLIQRFQGDFDNYNQYCQNLQLDLTPGKGGGHEHIHSCIVPLSPTICQTIQSILSNTKIEEEYEDKEEQLVHVAPPHFVLASYYMDGVPSKIFRFRLYSLTPTKLHMKSHEHNEDENHDDEENMDAFQYSNNYNVLLKLYTVDFSVMAQVKQQALDPISWESTLQESIDNSKGNGRPLFTLLKGCNVLWTPRPDPKRHFYLLSTANRNQTETDTDTEIILHSNGNNEDSSYSYSSFRSSLEDIYGKEDDSFHAIMLNETGAIVDSMMNPGKQIRIQDELSLWGIPNTNTNTNSKSNTIATTSDSSSSKQLGSALWINDRGFDTETNDYIYGNQRGIPYKMDRVTTFFAMDDDNNENNDDDDDDDEWIARTKLKDACAKELYWTLTGPPPLTPPPSSLSSTTAKEES